VTALLPADALERLIRLAGMMGSNQLGERAAAAAKATELLQAHKLTWRELLEGLRPAPALEPPERDWRADPWRSVVRRCLDHPELLSEWERRFCESIAWRAKLSWKQRSRLAKVADKIWEGTRYA
jgi:hypothetical protein